MSSRRLLIAAGLAALAAVSAPSVVRAQTAGTSRALTLSGGVMDFDLSGTGQTRMLAVRADFPVNRFALIEAGVMAGRPHQQGGDTITFVVPEVQGQLQLPLGRVAPYLGAGAGVAIASGDGQHDTEMTLSGAVGTRVAIIDRLGARAELRVRGIGSSFAGSVAEMTAGLSWRF